ncbi:hypothetical protein CJ030_MR8G003106 [Morella rubra]|uniref:Uncharacterized protein n=1 Tax=Morella rubra TaxID=262757 RepID=A0A6A1USM6_9ROSI|nr:hypothetical protein CJ030_MR8G003106 [Morella rubra]
MTPRTKDDVMPTGGKRLRCNSSVRAESSPGTLAVSGPSLRDRNELPSPTTASPVGTQSSCASTIRQFEVVRTGLPYSRLTPEESYCPYPYGRMGGDDKASSMLSSHIGALVRQHVPFDEKIQNLMRLVLCFIKKRILIRMACGHQKMHENFEKMEALQLQHELEGKSYTEMEIFAEVLGTKAGYVRGLGCSVRSVGSSLSASSVDLSWRLEEARLQIKEMRARQLEYEALLVKRSDMKQTMREHLQMMEE